VLGWCIYLPQFKGADIAESEVALDFIMGPGISLTGEVMWDQTLTKKQGAESLTVKL
jgi:hypothetical protein